MRESRKIANNNNNNKKAEIRNTKAEREITLEARYLA